MIKRIAIYFRNLIVVGVLLILVYLLFVIAVNWNDREPSSAAIEFEHYWDSEVPVADADNGYVYFRGMDAEKDADPLVVGVDRLKWLIEMRSKNPDMFSLPHKSQRMTDLMPVGIKKIFDACVTINQKCVSVIEDKKSSINSWTESESWILNRYKTLIQYGQWQEDNLFNYNLSFPNYSTLIQSQRLTYISLMAHLDQLSAEEISHFLEQDLIFWRMLLVKNKTIIAKMVSAAAIRNHFLFINQLFLTARGKGISLEIPAALIQSFIADEVSISSVVIGEWHYSCLAMDMYVPEDQDILEWATSEIAYKHQDSLNRHAEILNTLRHELDVPYEDFQGVFEIYQNKKIKTESITERLIDTYNVAGRLQLDIIPFDSYADYAARTKDLEGARQALLLSLQLMSAESDNIEPFNNKFHNPYTGLPFDQNKINRTILFTGLSASDRKRFQYFY